jgi:ferredoxin
LSPDTAHMIYFSPTGTTRTIVERITAASAENLSVGDINSIDLTPADSRTRSIRPLSNGFAVIGAPVYGGRIPSEAAARLRRIRATDMLAVIVVVYGNRAYDDALVELMELSIHQGFRPIAAGAFVGEHSYSSNAAPIAVGRPDEEDLAKAADFGMRSGSKIRGYSQGDALSPVELPGNRPYKEFSPSADTPLSDSTCTMCGSCVPVCPTDAIGMSATVKTDPDLCILCCACVKTCPVGARTIRGTHAEQIARWLSTNYSQRRESEVFL